MTPLFHRHRASPRWIKKAAVLVFVIALVALVYFGVTKREANQQAEELALINKASSISLEVVASDTFIAKTIDLDSGLPISGTLKALNSVIVRAKASGELHGLTIREGMTAQAGQLLGAIDSTEYTARLDQAKKTADAAKAQVEIAQRNFDNNKALADQNFISKTALDISRATLEGAKASHAAALASVDVAKKAFNDTRVIAPIAGVISARPAQPGERVNVESPIVEIVDLNRLELEAMLAPTDSVAVRTGQSAQLTIEGSTKTVQAHVTRINPSAMPNSRAVVVYLALENTTGLRQGLFAQGTLATSKVRALALPVSAIRYDKPAPYVQVIKNQKVAHKNITLGVKGVIEGVEYIAVQGLEENAVVLQGNVGAVREGIAVVMGQKKSQKAN